jgi:hypothetical protein
MVVIIPTWLGTPGIAPAGSAGGAVLPPVDIAADGF